MRCFERMLRRSGLPFHSSEGFNPSHDWFLRYRWASASSAARKSWNWSWIRITLEEIQALLAAQAPAGLEILRVQRVDPKAGAQVAELVTAWRSQASCAWSWPSVLPLSWQPPLLVERARPQPRQLDIRGYVRDLRLQEDDLEMDLVVTPQGTARPMRSFAFSDWGPLANGAVLERSRLEIDDEDLPRLAEACRLSV